MGVDMKTTSSSGPASRPAHCVRGAHYLSALLFLAACGGDEDPPTTNNPVGSAGVLAGATSGSGVAGQPAAGAAGRPVATAGTGSTPRAGTGATAGTASVAGTGAAGTAAGAAGVGEAGTMAMAGAPAAGTGAEPVAGTGSTEGPAMSAGCGKDKPATDTSIMVGSSTGTYILDVPPDYDNTKPYPLILVWHGATVTNTMFHGYLDMKAVAGNEAIIVTPECLDGGSSWPRDMAYPDALLEHFESNYCIDSSRIFTTGHSMGGQYTGMVGCQRGDKFRGNAVLAMSHPAGACVGLDTMSAMFSVGLSDGVVRDPQAEAKWWAESRGCDSAMTIPQTDPMQCVEYGGCTAGTSVRTCSFAGNHEIPNWTAGAVWNFFKKL